MVRSTRTTHNTTITQAILNGLSIDGGLYVFSSLPTIDTDSLYHMSYHDVAKHICTTLLNEFEPHLISSIIDEAYGYNFNPSPVTMTHKHNHSYLNLYHGPTLAFKDMALQLLPKLVHASKDHLGDSTPNLVLTATSGDTGSAALSGFSADAHVIVLYPADGVSEFQEKQMLSYQSDTCHVIAVEGNFDDCQNIVKGIFVDKDVDTSPLLSANSINIGRLIPQVVYYVYTYVQLVQDKIIQPDEEINIVVPTGNFGNIYAAYLAKQMGLPFNKLIIASNKNNILHEFFSTGVYDIRRSLHQTISPSMDIIISSNLERYLFDILEQDSNRLHDAMINLKKDGIIEIPQIKQQSTFLSGMADEDKTKRTVLKTLNEDNILIDPHTAVAKAVFDDLDESPLHTVIVSTASPYKFVDAMLDSLHVSTQGTLIEKINTLHSYDNKPLDKRIHSVASLNSKNRIVLSQNDTIIKIKEIVGDLNDR